jgi:hypothetical protein
MAAPTREVTVGHGKNAQEPAAGPQTREDLLPPPSPLRSSCPSFGAPNYDLVLKATVAVRSHALFRVGGLQLSRRDSPGRWGSANLSLAHDGSLPAPPESMGFRTGKLHQPCSSKLGSPSEHCPVMISGAVPGTGGGSGQSSWSDPLQAGPKVPASWFSCLCGPRG